LEKKTIFKKGKTLKFLTLNCDRMNLKLQRMQELKSEKEEIAQSKIFILAILGIKRFMMKTVI